MARSLSLLLVILLSACSLAIPPPPSNVKISDIRCGSATISWDEVANTTGYTVYWRLLDNDQSSQRLRFVSGSTSMQIASLLPSRDGLMRQYTVQVTSIQQGDSSEPSQDVLFTTNSEALRVEPFAQASTDGVIIRWSTPRINTGCDGKVIARYTISYTLVDSTDSTGSTQVDVEPDQSVMVEIDGLVKLAEYRYFVTSIDDTNSRRDARSSSEFFTTRDEFDIPSPPLLQYAEPLSHSVKLTWEPVPNGLFQNITGYVVQYRELIATSSGGFVYSATTLYQSFSGRTRSKGVIDGLEPDTVYDFSIASEARRVGLGQFEGDHLLVFTTSFVPVAPTDLTATVVSNRTLDVTWTYPSSLLDQIIAFEVSYSLVAAYDTVAGVKSFAESDSFNTTATVFHFAVLSSITSFTFSVTPYSAARPGESASLLVDDFSNLTAVEDPVSFFNLRLTDTSNDSSFSLSLEEVTSQLTQLISSNMCQCTLPHYTLRGTMELCDDEQPSCATYTGRILSTDTASSSELFEQVEVWLSAQNGSLLDGALEVDSSCPLRRLSPSDSVCSNFSDPEEEEEESDGEVVDILKMVGIGFGSGLAIIVCSLLVCVCVSKRRSKSDALTLSESNPNLSPFLVDSPNGRHYSVVLDRNPSYNRHHGKTVKPFQNTVFNGGHLEATSENDNRYSTNENPYSYTSLKTVQRQANIVIPEIQTSLEDEIFIGAHSPHTQSEAASINLSVDMEQPNRASAVSTNDYVVDSLQSSGYYSNGQELSTFPAKSYDGETYLSIS